MTKFTSFKYWYSLMLMLVAVSFTACVDDNDDTEAPFLEVSPTTLTFTEAGTPAEGSQSYFEIKTNRSWTATVQGDAEWVTLSKKAGEGVSKVEVSVPGGAAAETHIDIIVANKAGELLKETVKVFRTSSSGPVQTKVIYNETFGESQKDGNYWPFINQYSGWVTTGEGAANVTYEGSNVTVRSEVKAASKDYEGASGMAHLYIKKGATNFIVKDIALNSEQANLKLTFGSSYYLFDKTSPDETYKPAKLHVSLSADGVKWTEITTDAREVKGWSLITSNFTLKNASEKIFIKFAVDEEGVFSFDDITLSTGIGGQEVDLNAGSTEPEPQPGEAKEITFQELAEKMSAPGIIDAEFDRTLVAVVQNNMTTGTRSKNNLQLAAVDANAAGQGVTLYGNIIETAITELSLEQGDKVKVTFIKNMAETKVYNGLNQVTGGKDEVWAKIEKLNEKVAVTPVEITVDQLKDYQSMTVLIKNAATQEAGVWCTAENMKSTVLSVNGQNLTVFCAKGSAFAGVPYVATTGDIVGIASVHSNNVQLVPRSLEDVQAFNSTSATVTITGVNPAKLSFPAEGGEQKIAVTLANYNNEAISATGLSADKFTVSVSATEVTVKANPNEGAAINETLTIAVAGGNSVTVPVAVAAAGGQGGDEATYTLIEKVANLQPGKYYMAGYRVNYNNNGSVTDFSSHPYHVWNGTIKSSKDCDTDQYAFESGKLTAKDANKSLVEVELVAASGENAYYIKVGDKYLYSNTKSKPANRKLALRDDVTDAVWTFADFEAGAMLPSNNGYSMITAGAQSALIRSYATDSSTVTGASYGIAFFKKN